MSDWLILIGFGVLLFLAGWSMVRGGGGS